MTHVQLRNIQFPEMDEEFLNRRRAEALAKDFRAPYFDLAKQFAAADLIVIAAPYWDLSFPAVLKQYFEQISVIGLTFGYSEKNVPFGLCKAQKLYYVTTSGDPDTSDTFGFDYVKELAERIYGIPECVLFKADGLDRSEADSLAQMEAAKSRITEYCASQNLLNHRERRILDRADDNILQLREAYPDGLHFVVGDTHGEARTLELLLKKICFDPEKDHVYFVGDYNSGGNVHALLQVIAKHYAADYSQPGFHLIRGNHERELGPWYPMENQPDILVLRGKQMNYYIVHAGMLASAFDLIRADMAADPDKAVYAYRLDASVAGYNGPLRQIIWSRNGLYSKYLQGKIWPSREALLEDHACILHGHAPYCFFKDGDRFSYGGRQDAENLFFAQQHIWFSEDLQSFNLDSDVKGRCKNGETYRGLTALCLEVCGEIAAQNGGMLTIDGIRNATNAVFGMPLDRTGFGNDMTDLTPLLTAQPEMKTILLTPEGQLAIC